MTHTIEFLKKKAKQIKKKESVPHYVALDLAAVLLGFENYKNFLDRKGKP